VSKKKTPLKEKLITSLRDVFWDTWYCDLFFIEVQLAKRHGESTSTASQLSHIINKVPLLLQNLELMSFYYLEHLDEGKHKSVLA